MIKRLAAIKMQENNGVVSFLLSVTLEEGIFLAFMTSLSHSRLFEYTILAGKRCEMVRKRTAQYSKRYNLLPTIIQTPDFSL